jgi:hypothetical protein
MSGNIQNIQGVDLRPQQNFLDDKIPHDTAVIYNTAGFIENLLQALTVQINQDNQAAQRGNDELQKAAQDQN